MPEQARTLIANLELTVCSIETQAKHPELFHYTKPAAFENIVKSNTFWASHYRDMVDPTEVLLMRNRLPLAIGPRFDEIVSSKVNRHARRLWKKSGAGLGTARDFVESLYGATFDKRSDLTAMDAFIASFSTHAAEGDFEREHGIWNQWRDYAGLDGFCIVLETAALGRMLGEEMDTRYWAHLMLDPVRYGDAPIEELFPELLQASADTLRQFLDGEKEPEMAVQQFLVGSTLLKDASYRPECEVRIVGIPGTKRMSYQAAHDHPATFKVLPLPEIRRRPGTMKRYVTIFEGGRTKLPIKRVIAGPMAGRQGVDFAHSLINAVPVTLSRSTPG
jgi:hypothetical protein